MLVLYLKLSAGIAFFLIMNDGHLPSPESLTKVIPQEPDEMPKKGGFSSDRAMRLMILCRAECYRMLKHLSAVPRCVMFPAATRFLRVLARGPRLLELCGHCILVHSMVENGLE